MAIQNIKKLETLQEKRKALQEKEDRIKAEILQELSETLIAAQAIEIDFYTLVGGILDVVEKSKAASQESEVWKNAGEKFCKGRSKRKDQKNPKAPKPIKKDKGDEEQE